MFVIARFRREIPRIEGMRVVVSLDNYSIFEVNDFALARWPANIEYEEITELEGTTAWKFYSEVRPGRSAYSDIEGLVPDKVSSKGVNKTTVPYTMEIYTAVVTLMKRIFKRNVKDVFTERGNHEGEQELLDRIDTISTIRELSYERERLLGTEMSKTQLKELHLWEDDYDRRNGKHNYLLGF